MRRAARREAERTLAERTRYIVDDAGCATVPHRTGSNPPPNAERGLRRLIEKPSVLPEA